MEKKEHRLRDPHISRRQIVITVLLLFIVSCQRSDEIAERTDLGQNMQDLLDKEPGAFKNLSRPDFASVLQYIELNVKQANVPAAKKESVLAACQQIRNAQLQQKGFNPEVIAGLAIWALPFSS